MLNARIETAQDADGMTVVLACFDLGDVEISAAVHAVRTAAVERYRPAEMSVDDVLELRELTVLADELDELVRQPGIRTLVLRPARLSVCRDAVAHFVETREDAEWMRDDDRLALPSLRALVEPLDALSADALRAALLPPASHA